MDNRKKLPNGWTYLGSSKDVEMVDGLSWFNDETDDIDENLVDENIEFYEKLYDRTLHGEFFYPDDEEDDFEDDIVEIIS